VLQVTGGRSGNLRFNVLATLVYIVGACGTATGPEWGYGYQLREKQRGLAEEDVKLLSLVDILEPLSREELEGLNWKHLDTHVEQGVGGYYSRRFIRG
jgi:hypothetical protein